MPISPVKNKKNSLKEHVIEVAQELFYKNGIKSVTMDCVARSLHMSKRTLYELFADKEELLIAGQEKMYEEHRQALERLATHTDNVIEIILYDVQLKLKAMTKVSKEFIYDIHKYERLRDNIHRHREENKADAINFIKHGIEQGLLRNDFNVEVAYEVSLSIIDSLVEKKLFNSASPIDVLNTSIISYLRGLSTEKGAALLDVFISKHRAQ